MEVAGRRKPQAATHADAANLRDHGVAAFDRRQIGHLHGTVVTCLAVSVAAPRFKLGDVGPRYERLGAVTFKHHQTNGRVGVEVFQCPGQRHPHVVGHCVVFRGIGKHDSAYRAVAADDQFAHL